MAGSFALLRLGDYRWIGTLCLSLTSLTEAKKQGRIRGVRVIHAPALKSGRESEGVISAACPDVALQAAFHGVSRSPGKAEMRLAERFSPAETPDMARDLHAEHINNDCRGHDNPGAGQKLHDAIRASLL